MLRPAYAGPPRARTILLGASSHLFVTAFTAGADGSIIRKIWTQTVGDSAVSLTIGIYNTITGFTIYSRTVVLSRVSIAAGTAANFGGVENHLTETMFPGLSLDPDGRYFDLAPGEEIVATLHDGAGAAPAAGTAVELRVAGGDY